MYVYACYLFLVYPFYVYQSANYIHCCFVQPEREASTKYFHSVPEISTDVVWRRVRKLFLLICDLSFLFHASYFSTPLLNCRGRFFFFFRKYAARSKLVVIAVCCCFRFVFFVVSWRNACSKTSISDSFDWATWTLSSTVSSFICRMATPRLKFGLICRYLFLAYIASVRLWSFISNRCLCKYLCFSE